MVKAVKVTSLVAPSQDLVQLNPLSELGSQYEGLLVSIGSKWVKIL